jgi:hypothetical protein
MTNPKILTLLRQVIELEEGGVDANAAAIEEKCSEALRLANVENLEISPDIYRYFDDFDIRRKDKKYRKYQTAQVENLLANGRS